MYKLRLTRAATSRGRGGAAQRSAAAGMAASTVLHPNSLWPTGCPGIWGRARPWKKEDPIGYRFLRWEPASTLGRQRKHAAVRLLSIERSPRPQFDPYFLTPGLD